MKAIGIILTGLGIAGAFFAFLLFILEEYSGSYVCIPYILLGIAVAFIGFICLTIEEVEKPLRTRGHP